MSTMPFLPTEQPLVSVIIPVYNAGKYLRETLDCVCGQTLREIEIICVDDGSTDDSLNILQEYAAKDGRMRILQQKNQYAGVARNHGMAVARGKYLSFLDADDLFEPDMLEAMVEQGERNGAEIVLCEGFEFQDGAPEMKQRTGWLDWSLLEGYNPQLIDLQSGISRYIFRFTVGWTWDKLFHRGLVERWGLEFPPSRHCNDAPFVYPAMCLAKTATIVQRELVRHRKHRASLEATREKDPGCVMDCIRVIERKLRSCGASESALMSYRNWRMEYLAWGVFSMKREGWDAYISAIKEGIPGEGSLWDAVVRDSAAGFDFPDVYRRLKAVVAPEFVFYLGNEGVSDKVMKEAALSVLDQANMSCAVVFPVDVVPAALERDPRVHTMNFDCHGIKRFWLPAGRGLVSDDRLVHALESLREEAGVAIPVPRRYTYNVRLRRLFYIRCGRSYLSWRFFGVPIVTISFRGQYRQIHVLGRLVFLRRIR